MSEREKHICLDPGHDAGNLANKSPDGTYYEHVFTLDLGKRLEKLLTDRGVSVTMTRTGGGAVSLARRCEIANSIPDLDLFVSLHSNAAAGGGWSSAKGWSVYLYGPGGDRERAAQDILEQVRAAGIAVRSTPIVYDPELYVLKHTKAPAVLLENGFNVRVRMPLLHGVNDDKAEIDAMIEFFTPYRYQKNFDGVDLLPYHKLGVGKYAQLGRDYEIEGDPSLSEDDLNRIEGWISEADFKVNLVRH